MRKKASFLCLLAGFVLALAPVVLGLADGLRQKQVVATFEQEVSVLDPDQAGTVLAEAREWDMARRTGTATGQTYAQVLDFTGTGIMATLTIPKISVELPVYHGTGEEVLSVGAGHLESSDLPVGGPGTRSVISAHRGLPSARLFTRLDELVNGDLFFLQTGQEILAYEVADIQVIRPDQADQLAPVTGQDLVSLVTCTPYGINTHRLVVTGRRVPYSPQTREAILPAAPSIRELLIFCLPGAFALAALLLYRKERR